MHRCVELEKGEACTPQVAYSVWSPFARYSNVNLIALAGESIVYRSICLLRRRHSCLEIIKTPFCYYVNVLLLSGWPFPSLSLHQIYWPHDVICWFPDHVAHLQCHGEPFSTEEYLFLQSTVYVLQEISGGDHSGPKRELDSSTRFQNEGFLTTNNQPYIVSLDYR